MLRLWQPWAAMHLLATLSLVTICCSQGRDRDLSASGEADANEGPFLRLREEEKPDGPRKVKEEVLSNRRGPAWLAKLPQKLQKGDSGNRPFAVKDARVARGLIEAVGFQTPVAKSESTMKYGPVCSEDTRLAVAEPSAPSMSNAISIMQPRAPASLQLLQAGPLLVYDQEHLLRQHAWDAWNSMLENARVGILSRGKLIVEPRLKGSASSIMAAALSGDVDQLKAALDEDGGGTAVTNSVGETPLMLAAISGNTDTMTVLLARGAELDTRDVHGWTALMKAVALGDGQAVEFLLAAGANTEIANRANQTACLIAGSWGKKSVQRILIGAGACQAPAEPSISRVHPDQGTMYAEPQLKGETLGRLQVFDHGDPLCIACVPSTHTGTHTEIKDAKKWKQEADVLLRWQLEREQDAEEWLRQLSENHARHLTQYHMIKQLEVTLAQTQQRLERAEDMLQVCQKDFRYAAVLQCVAVCGMACV